MTFDLLMLVPFSATWHRQSAWFSDRVEKSRLSCRPVFHTARQSAVYPCGPFWYTPYSHWQEKLSGGDYLCFRGTDTGIDAENNFDLQNLVFAFFVALTILLTDTYRRYAHTQGYT